MPRNTRASGYHLVPPLPNSRRVCVIWHSVYRSDTIIPLGDIVSQCTSRWCLCAVRTCFHLPPGSGTTAAILFSFSLVVMSGIFWKRATVAYLYLLSLSSQSRRVITVYEFPLLFHASVHPTLTLFQCCRISRKGSDPHVKKERGSRFTDLT